MAITLTRRLAHQVRAVFRRALGLTRSAGPAISLGRGPDGLRVRVRSFDVAVEYHDSTAGAGGAAETLWLPFQFLEESQGKKDEPVQVEAAGTGRVTAQWRDGNVPQIIQYDASPPAGADAFPTLPDDLAENPASLLQALLDAGETTDPDSTRYALGCLRLRGEDGTIAASDGRQLLVQGGFHFPWSGDLLLPRNNVFGSPELPGNVPVEIGKAGNWVVLRAGPWCISLQHNQQGRFPKLETHVPRSDTATARCRFSEADAAFLADTLPRLPSSDRDTNPVTVDLNGAVVVRSRGADPTPPTEAVARNSTWEGEPLRINSNRHYLARALRLGFRELSLFSPEAPAACYDGPRTYVWALLDPKAALPPAEGAIRIESPVSEPENTVPQRQPRRSPSPMHDTTPQPAADVPARSNGHAPAGGPTPAAAPAPTNGRARAAGGSQEIAPQPVSRQDLSNLIEQAEALRESLRDSLAKTSELVRGLKQHRRATRTLESTLGAIRQLQTLSL